MRFLVTAGGTSEQIDDVRRWGNVFTGKTGLAIARALAEVGAVDLVTSNADHPRQLQNGPVPRHAMRPLAFETHAELRGLLSALMACEHYDAVFMTAAVSDYRPSDVFTVLRREPAGESMSAGRDEGRTPVERWLVRSVHEGKVKSTHAQIAVLGERTEKLVDMFRRQWRFRGLLVKFKLEVGIARDRLIDIARRSRIESGADYIVANTLAMTQGHEAGAFLLGSARHEWVARGQLPGRLVQLVTRRCAPCEETLRRVDEPGDLIDPIFIGASF